MTDQPPTRQDAHRGAEGPNVQPDPDGKSDVSRTPYDLDRAARAGGFEGDLETGQIVARRLHAILRRRTDNRESLDHVEMRTEWIDSISDLWEGDPSSNTMWLATISNTYNALIRDLSAQVRQARGLPR